MKMRKSISTAIVAVMLASLGLVTTPASAALLYQFSGSGDYASARLYAGGEYVYVWVSQEVSGANTYTRLIYSTRTADGAYKYWAGSIPATSITGAATGSLTVDLDTCTVNPTAGCGPVSLTWSATNAYVGKYSGRTMNSDDGITRQFVGTSTRKGSLVTGVVGDVTLDGLASSMGKYSNATVVVRTVN